MIPYSPPLDDMRFALSTVAELDALSKLPGCENASPDLVDAILDEAAKLAHDVIAPLNQSGDREGARFENGVVRSPEGFKQAYARYVEGGWNSLPFDPDYGGQGLPFAVATAVLEMWNSASMAFALCPLLNVGAVELLQAHGSPQHKSLYLDRMVSGEWTGTMNLTEPQAGSDLGALRTRAVRDGDHYRITGQKIYISYGDHDLTPNIIHLVLARTPDAPAGSKGISLFIVPKMLVGEDGGILDRNDLRCVSLEHKLGIHASPTAVMAFGDNGGAVGYLIGQENRGLEYMFTMMNNARLNVGLQGVAIGERAYQQALAYARQRIQGRPLPGTGPTTSTEAPTATEAPTILYHPDIRRMLISMKARVEAARALAYFTAAALDRARRHPDAATREHQQALVDLLIPVVKAWSTDLGVDVASCGIQIHGGMGFIEETGAAQHLRDARIAPIYEGTNGIQALDLVARKLSRDGGRAARTLIAVMRETEPVLAARPGDDLAVIRSALIPAIDDLERATDWLLQTWPRNAGAAAAGALPYLSMLGTVAGGWLMAREALAADAALRSRDGNPAWLETKIVTTRFYAEQILPSASALLAAIRGGATVMAFNLDQL